MVTFSIMRWAAILLLLTAVPNLTMVHAQQGEVQQGRGLVSYVLENFDVATLGNTFSADPLRAEIDFWAESGQRGTLTPMVTADALHGNSALALHYHNAESFTNSSDTNHTYVLQSLLDETAVHVGAAGAWYAVFTYRHELADGFETEMNGFVWRLVLYDSADCVEDCSNEGNLEGWEYVGGDQNRSMVSDNSWQTVYVPLNTNDWMHIAGQGNGEMDLRKLKGWRLEFSSTVSDLQGTIVVDQLALEGDGSMIGATFRATSWEQALNDDLVVVQYYLSEFSEENTQETISDGRFMLNYTVQQTEQWGGFIQYDFSAPGRSYFNLSRAESIGFDYEILQPSSDSGRAHLRLTLLDSSDCWDDCGHDSKNVENYYSFHYILDEKTNTKGFVSVQLKGDSDTGSPFLRTGWFGSIGNDVLDKATIKGFKIEISMDSLGEIDSLVSGSFDLSGLRAFATNTPSETDTSMCIVEPDILFERNGVTKFVIREFLSFEECCKECDADPSCTFAYTDQIHCYKTDYVHHEDVVYRVDVDIPLTTFVKESNEDFCEACECRQSDATIDCRGRDLVVAPKTFTPAPGSISWEAKVLDLRENPRLVVLHTGALENLASLQVLHLPSNVKYLSPVTMAQLSSLREFDFEDPGKELGNFIMSPSQSFLDVCCSLGEKMTFESVESSPTTLTFCKLEPDIPGVDAIYEDYVQYIGGYVVDSLTPSSSFMSEAALGVEMCAEYCNIVSDCRYFTYDTRITNAEPRCELLATKGTLSKQVCCAPNHYADSDRTEPGWTSGYVPRTRNEVFGARVVLETAKPLVMEKSNGYVVKYKLKLGAMPRRGAVWIRPSVFSQGDPEMEVVISPSHIVLYDNTTKTTVEIFVANPNEITKGGAIVIENIVESCDGAFSSSLANLTVYADVKLLTNDSTTTNLLIAGGVFLFIILSITAFFVYYVQRKKRQADAVWHVEPEELKFQEPPEVLGRGSFGLVLSAEYRGTKVAVKRMIPPRRGKCKESKSPGILATLDRLFGSAAATVDFSEHTDVETGPGTSSKHVLGIYNADPVYTKNQRSSVAQAKHWRKAFRASRDEDYLTLRANFVEEMRHLSKLRHPCIATIMGAVVKEGAEPMLVMEYMDHGSLFDLLQNETVELEGEQILRFLKDISQGVRFLHSAKPQVLHGDLKAANILVDGRLRAKVADFGLSQKRRVGSTGTPYWMAPELLRGISTNTAASDVYSFGVLLYEVYARREPYEGEDFTEVMESVSNPNINKRPEIPAGCPSEIESLMTQCQMVELERRPSFEEIDDHLRNMDAAKVEPLRQSLAKTASFIVKQHRGRSDTLLEEVFPPHIARALRDGRKIEPEARDMVTIVFSDIVGFTTIASQLSAMAISEMLDRLYSKFDDLSRKHDVFKVETIGDAWMGVTNLTKEQPDHAQRIARFALDAMKAAQETWIDPSNISLGKINLRMGFHSGPVVASVIGSRNPRYCLFGDSVNSSSRMESHSLPGAIQCSEASATILKANGCDIPITDRGVVHIKGKGEMNTYWIGPVPQTPRETALNGPLHSAPNSTVRFAL